MASPTRHRDAAALSLAMSQGRSSPQPHQLGLLTATCASTLNCEPPEERDLLTPRPVPRPESQQEHPPSEVSC